VDELDATPVSRRGFLGFVGAGAALAGISLSGCLRKPVDPIVPFSQRPEDLIPGRPRYYATSAMIGGGVLGLLVESQDGRPTKIEGLAAHPSSQGSASAWAQAELLGLYDPGRARRPLREGKETSWEAFAQRAAALRKDRGRGLALLTSHLTSPTWRRLLGELGRALPEARLYLHDECYPRHTLRGSALVGASGRLPLLQPDRADVILALDSDFLGLEGDATRNQRLFARRRQVLSQHSAINRLYAVEPYLTLTGAAADHRLPLRGSEVEAFARALVGELARQGLQLPAPVRAVKGDASRWGKWVPAVAADLLRNRGRALVVVGERQPAPVHGLGILLNHALENEGRTVNLVPDADAPEARSLEELADELRAGKVRTLVVLGGNPVATAPGDLGLGELIAGVPERIHLSDRVDETAALCGWQLPRSHFLEAWGDHRASDGTLSLQQPLIAPLFDSRSELEVLALLVGAPTGRGYELVRETWRLREGAPASAPASAAGAAATPASAPAAASALQDRSGAAQAGRPFVAAATHDFERRWRRWLHDGVVALPDTASQPPPELRWESLGRSRPPAVILGLELSLHPSPALLDGRYAQNGWLQELPDPITKLTWGNAACLGPATAAAQGVRTGDVIELSLGGRTASGPALIVPGVAEGVVALTLGHGRAMGTADERRGVAGAPLRVATSPSFAGGLSLRRLGGRYRFAMTQEHWSMEGRPLIREATLEEFQANPRFAQVEHEPPLRSLWKEPNERRGRQWGMSVDLNACLGCGACVVACQAENNIPVVGPERVRENREMHWLRIDRYYAGDPAAPQVRFQPVACMQCETAPCEQVCPVAASSHTAEGLNDQVYNRCIGTRYCSNNCPYKVRRFNFFQYNSGLDPLHRMQKNPDVSMRFRGIMEKCTYCVQRIQEAKIAAKVRGDGVIADGAVVPACAQTCPAQAIVFGDLSQEDSLVAQRKRQSRDYGILTELQTKPRTTYLAKLRNPNPELV